LRSKKKINLPKHYVSLLQDLDLIQDIDQAPDQGQDSDQDLAQAPCQELTINLGREINLPLIQELDLIQDLDQDFIVEDT
jgi:hypothetical protein